MLIQVSSIYPKPASFHSHFTDRPQAGHPSRPPSLPSSAYPLSSPIRKFPFSSVTFLGKKNEYIIQGWRADEGNLGAPMSSLSDDDCFSDLLCGEDAGSLATDDEHDCSVDLCLPEDVEDLMAELVAEEADYFPGSDYSGRFRSRSLDAAARSEAIAWILKVHGFYNFQPLTAYLSVNYMDRFLASHYLPQASGWPLQLLSVASLSLAAKMEETLVPSLLDLQIDARFVFEPQTIRRMELLVLNALDWRLRSITPFDFIDFFAYKTDPDGALTRFLVSRTTQIVLASIQEINFLEYSPSSVAAAAMVCAADAFPNLSHVNPVNAESWCVGLSKEKIASCYKLVQQLGIDSNTNSRNKPPKIFPELRVTAALSEMGSGDSYCSSSLTPKKRRKITGCQWVDDNEDVDGRNKEGSSREEEEEEDKRYVSV